MEKSYSKNVELLAYHDLKGRPGFQMGMQVVEGRYYLYLAHFKHAGWDVMEVSEPSKPRYIKFIPGPDLAGQTTPKLQVADGIMVTSLQGGSPMFHGMSKDDPYEEGIYVWDVKDPENPKWLSHWKSGGPFAVHRFFYSGGRYIHLSAACKGFSGLIYRIIDIADPARPVETGRWWLPEQWEAGGGINNDWHVLHGPAYPKGNFAYCSYGRAGMVILDISDISLPKLVGRLQHHPPFGGGNSGATCHTVLPLSKRPFAVMTGEGERRSCFNKEIINGKAEPLNLFGMIDIIDPANPTLISLFPYPEIPPDFPYKNFNLIEGIEAPFGPHNLHEPHYHPALEDRNDRIYCAYFHAGLRIYNISDPYVPREIGYYIPPNPSKWAFNNKTGNLYPGPMIATAEDVLVDNRGFIYMTTFHDGLYILKCNV